MKLPVRLQRPPVPKQSADASKHSSLIDQRVEHFRLCPSSLASALPFMATVIISARPEALSSASAPVRLKIDEPPVMSLPHG